MAPPRRPSTVEVCAASAPDPADPSPNWVVFTSLDGTARTVPGGGMRGYAKVTPMYPGTHAERNPDRAAIIMAGSGATVTYRQLDERSNQLAHLLRGAGLRRGDHVALFMENHPDFIEIVWAALRSGLYLTAINSHLTAEEVGYIVGDCDAQAFLTSKTLCGVASEIDWDALSRVTTKLMVDG